MIDVQSGVSIGLAVIIATALVRGVWLLSGVVRRLDAMEKDSITLSRASEVAYRTKLANPSIRVVDPRCPHKFIEISEERS